MVKEVSVERNEFGIVIRRCGHRCGRRCHRRCGRRCGRSCGHSCRSI